MRTMALDIGERRIGVALGRPEDGVASPHTIIDAKSVADTAREIARIVEDWEVDHIVVGLPLSLSGEEGPQARHVRNRAQRLLDGTGLPVTFVDERHTSTDAKRILAEQGFSSRDSRGQVDAIAASLILELHFDSMRSGTDKGECDGA